MKRKIINFLTAIVLISVMAISSVGYAQSNSTEFTDVPKNKAYYEAVHSLSSRGYINGYEDGTFRPAANVTRGQAAKIIANVLQLDIKNVKDPKFKDIPTTYQYYGYIAALVEAGIISGYDDQTFKPNESMTRAHMSKMISKGFDLQEPDANFTSPFQDVSSKNWFAPFVESLRIHEITTGTTPTTFSPGAFVTRSQLASFVTRSEKVITPEVPETPETPETPGPIIPGKPVDEDFIVDSIE